MEFTGNCEGSQHGGATRRHDNYLRFPGAFKAVRATILSGTDLNQVESSHSIGLTTLKTFVFTRNGPMSIVARRNIAVGVGAIAS